MPDPTQPYVWTPGDSVNPLAMWEWPPNEVQRASAITFDEARTLSREYSAVQWMTPAMAKDWLASKSLTLWQQIAMLRSAGLKISPHEDHNYSPTKAAPVHYWSELCCRRAALWLAGASFSQIGVAEGVSGPSVAQSISRILPTPRSKMRPTCTWDYLYFMRNTFMTQRDSFNGQDPVSVARILMSAADAVVETDSDPLGDYGLPIRVRSEEDAS
jgi:hypothetical protein